MSVDSSGATHREAQAIVAREITKLAVSHCLETGSSSSWAKNLPKMGESQKTMFREVMNME